MIGLVILLVLHIGVFSITENEASSSTEYCSNIQLKYPANLYNTTSLIDEFPHMAGIKCNHHWKCAGVLISEKYVLTSAHCIEHYKYENPPCIYKVRLGSDYFNDGNDDVAVARVIQHPDYKVNSFYNDVGLVELEESINISDRIRPACLETVKRKYYASLVATSYQLFFNNGTGELAKWNYTEMVYDKCRNFYKNGSELLNGILEDQQICVENLMENSTNLESGDPLQTFDSLYGYKIVGIVDFGQNRITNEEYRYGCNRILYYIDWIESIVWPKLFQDVNLFSNNLIPTI